MAANAILDFVKNINAETVSFDVSFSLSLSGGSRKKYLPPPDPNVEPPLLSLRQILCQCMQQRPRLEL